MYVCVCVCVCVCVTPETSTKCRKSLAPVDAAGALKALGADGGTPRALMALSAATVTGGGGHDLQALVCVARAVTYVLW